jgi:hypothetical protein
MARPQHSPKQSRTQAPASSLDPEQKPKPKKNFFVEDGRKKMPDPEENHLGLSIQKVLVHIGRITPSSDRSPHSGICVLFVALFLATFGRFDPSDRCLV